MDYLKMLKRSHKMTKEMSDCIGNEASWLGGSFFDFTTYDNDLSEKMARNMLDVIYAIWKRETFDYIDKSQENYENYITMVNMPFLDMYHKLDWGGSIRGAWFALYEGGSETFEFDAACFWDENNEQMDSIKFDHDEWADFILAMTIFVNEATTYEEEVQETVKKVAAKVNHYLIENHMIPKPETPYLGEE